MGKSAVRHVSARVPWHDSGWNGYVCRDPQGNSSCLALNRIAENREDDEEDRHSGKDVTTLDRLPPCIIERGNFLSDRATSLPVVLDYSKYSESHKHILPGTVHVPAFGGVLTPYRWMLREYAWDLAKDFGAEAMESQEPNSSDDPKFIVNSPWVQNCENQRLLLDAFSNAFSEDDSLVFFYAKQTPLIDGSAQQIVAVAKLSAIQKVDEYPYEGGRADGRRRSMMWERPFQHSLRPDPDNPGEWFGGVVLPYQQILSMAESDGALDPSEYAAVVPDEAHHQFRYASEHVTHGSAITALQAMKTALEKASLILNGPWNRYIGWIDAELSKLWTMQGPTPGLGSALSCLDPNFNGTLFAHALASELDEGVDPWPVIDAIFSGQRGAPAGAPKPTTMQKSRWAHYRDEEPIKLQLMRLLACFELSKDQALNAFASDDAQAVLANPYLLFEESRASDTPIALLTIDRGLFPADAGQSKPDFPDLLEIDLDEADHPLRLRAIVIDALEKAALAGHTIVDASRLNTLVADLPISVPMTVDAPALTICASILKPAVLITKSDERTLAQLARYVDSREIIRDHVMARLKPVDGPDAAFWKAQVEGQFGAPSKDDEDEIAAQVEKVKALDVLARTKLSVLTGPAGTGKTTLLKILLEQTTIVGREVLLLAPTGKARVRLGQQTGNPDQARTLAQFLLEHERYEGSTGRYFANSSGPTASVSTCVVDESSMLTEDQLAALCSALPVTARLILVGDPFQLPPIGAGRPFVDIIEYLRSEHATVGLAELTVSRRQGSEGLEPALSLSDVQLANLFSGRAQEPGEDEVVAKAGAPMDDDRLRLVGWNTPTDLRERLLEVLTEELKADPENLERTVELSLGGTESNNYVYFNSGAGKNAEDWQILSPHRNQSSGASEINRYLKQTVRRKRLESARNARGWRMIEPRGSDQITYGDKVICLRNHTKYSWNKTDGKERGYLANGEVGVVIGDAGKGRQLTYTEVEFASQPGKKFGFSRSDFSEEKSPTLELAYAVTVHKAQGSEFGAVILILPERSQLLTREMLYTALTRQKNRVWVLHQGPFNSFLRLRSDFYSEIAQRSTNLFAEPALIAVQIPAGFGSSARQGWFSENLIHMTRRGDLVSSKSELIVADKLYDLEQKQLLRYSFEKQYVGNDGKMRLPDFTIEQGDEVWLWEHCGLMGQADYVARWNRKLEWYKEQGITPWSKDNPTGRLIVTMDSVDGGIDSAAIHAIAEKLFGSEVCLN